MKAAAEFWKAIEVEKLADELIPLYHGHLLDAKLLYLFTDQEMTKHQRPILGKTAKLSGVAKYLSSGMRSVLEGMDFILVFNHERWQDLTEAQRRALVDHELCHAIRVEKETKNGVEGRWSLRGHDVEEFHEVIMRHGLWIQDVEVMAETIRQLPLLGHDA